MISVDFILCKLANIFYYFRQYFTIIYEKEENKMTNVDFEKTEEEQEEIENDEICFEVPT